MPSILDQILAAERRRTATVGPFPLRGDDAPRLREARSAVAEARKSLDNANNTTDDPDDDRLVQRRTEQLEAAEAELDKVAGECPCFTIHVQEVQPASVVEQLMAEHPPTAEQRKKAKGEGHKGALLFDEEAFPVPFLTLAITAIDMAGETQTDLTESDVRALWNKLNESDRGLVFGAAWMLRSAPTLVGDLGKG